MGAVWTGVRFTEENQKGLEWFEKHTLVSLPEQEQRK